MSFSLKLDVNAHNVLCACSLCDMMMEKINTLQQTYKTIEAVEIHLFESVVEKVKGVTVKHKNSARYYC
jgi:lipoate-protein ligase B